MTLETTKQLMMEKQRFTNIHNLYEPLYKSLIEDEYDDGGADFSVTTLIKSPYKVQLCKKHKDKIVTDALDNLFKLEGTIAHKLVLKHAKGVVEKRFFTEVNGLKISGQPDIFCDGEIVDVKRATVYKIKKRDFKDWIEQLNLYDYILHKNGLEATSLRIIALLRDWSFGYVGKQHNYPLLAYFDSNFPKWSREEQKKFLEERVALHQNPNPEPCSKAETWGWKMCNRYCSALLFCPANNERKANAS